MQNSLIEFRRLQYPEAGPDEWNDWRWQIRNRVTTPKRLKQFLSLGPAEEEIFSGGGVMFPFSITPYFLSVLAAAGGEELRKTVIPRREELCVSSGDKIDPLSEHADTVAPGLVHRYPDRVLFLVTDFCSTYCRYCTRSRIVGKPSAGLHRRGRWEEALRYIEGHTEVRDVLLSGGDPLTLEDHELEWLLCRLSAIPHLEMIRIGTKVPAVLPMRITRQLTDMLKQFHPLWMSLHFSHPAELTEETGEACRRLADAGIPLGSQTVLLKGVNDSAPVLKALFHGLLRLRVRPYYLYQCDPVVGASHFRTPVEQGLRLIEELRGYTSGYAVPMYVVDAPGGGGKIPLLQDHILGREGDALLLANYERKVFRYPDPEGTISSCSIKAE